MHSGFLYFLFKENRSSLGKYWNRLGWCTWLHNFDRTAFKAFNTGDVVINTDFMVQRLLAIAKMEVLFAAAGGA